MSANGVGIWNWCYFPGGGSGGGVYLTCKRFTGGAKGVIRANGGNDDPSQNGAAGGGGRIAIAAMAFTEDPAFAVQANAGTGHYTAQAGTIVRVPLSGAGTIMIVR